MNKVVELIEKYIQWVALVLGAAFVGLMVFRYFLNTPNIAGNSPGNIDKATVDGPVSQLEAKKNSATLADLPVPTFTADFKASLSGPSTRPLLTTWLRSNPLPADLVPGSSDVKFDPSAPSAAGFQGSGPVAAIPTLPAAKPIGVTQGISTVNPLLIVPAAQPNLLPPPLPPGTPVAPPVPAFPGQAAIAGVDKFWVTTAFEIPVAAIAAEFTAAKVPAGLNTSFLRVELQREELNQANGTWSNSVIVRPLANSQAAQNPLPAPGNATAEITYRAWAEANQIEIVQPGFYAMMGGSQWSFPTTLKNAAGELVFDPLKYLTGPIPTTITQEQRALIMRERQRNAGELERRRREERKNAAPPPGAGGGGATDLPRGGNYGGAPFVPPAPAPFSSLLNFAPQPALPAPHLGGGRAGAPSAENVLFQIRPGVGGRPPGYPPGEPWPPSGEFATDGMEGSGQGPGGAIQQASLGPINSGPFDPQLWAQGPINSIQHDETVEPGKIYRYRIRYVMLSPVYNQPVATAKPELATTFRWDSAWSDWTANVNVPNAVSFFVASNIPPSANSVTFEVFKYAAGQMRSKVFPVTAGDFIGAADATSDLSTGFALVDIRRDAKGQNYALIMSPDGTLVKRDFSDTRSEQYIDFKKQVTPPTLPGANPAGGNPGGYPGGGAPR